MEKHVYTREIPAEEGYDIVVAGGGPAGCAAAICAARLGAKVLLVEAMGCLGGAGTSGLVTSMGELGRKGTVLLGGFMSELYHKLADRGILSGKSPTHRNDVNCFVWEPFDAEGLKLVLDEYMQEEHVEVRFFTHVIDVEYEAEPLAVKGLILSNIEGLRYVSAKAYLDCTGDAVLAAKCGVAFNQPEVAMPPTLMATLCGVDWEALEKSGTLGGGQLKGQQETVDRALDEGTFEFTYPDRHIPGIFIGIGNKVTLNAGHVFKMDALNNKSLSEGMMTGRRLVQEYLRFFKQSYPELSGMELAATAPLMGVRDSRRIIGEYCLGYDDYLAKRKFPDQVCLNAQEIDLHVRDCSKEEYSRFHSEFFETTQYGPGEYFGIPYGVMVPKGAVNLWVAGRTVSCDDKVNASIRMMPVCYTLGQAAGTAAVQAIKNHEHACSLNTKTLIETLRANGALLPQETLSETMSRN